MPIKMVSSQTDPNGLQIRTPQRSCPQSPTNLSITSSRILPEFPRNTFPPFSPVLSKQVSIERQRTGYGAQDIRPIIKSGLGSPKIYATLTNQPGGQGTAFNKAGGAGSQTPSIAGGNSVSKKSSPSGSGSSKCKRTKEAKTHKKKKNPHTWPCELVPLNVPRPDVVLNKVHPGKDVFVLKVAKVSSTGERRCKMELELVTPKGNTKKIPGRTDTRDTQCDLECPACCYPCSPRWKK